MVHPFAFLSRYHVALYAREHHVIEARPRGVVRRDFRSDAGGDECIVIPAPQGKGAQALAWAEQQIGDDYAALGVVALVLDRLFTHLRLNYTSPRRRLTCGGFVVQAFQ